MVLHPVESKGHGRVMTLVDLPMLLSRSSIARNATVAGLPLQCDAVSYNIVPAHCHELCEELVHELRSVDAARWGKWQFVVKSCR